MADATQADMDAAHAAISGPGTWEDRVGKAIAQGRAEGYAAGRAEELADVLGHARRQSYGPTLRTFIKQVAREQHIGASKGSDDVREG